MTKGVTKETGTVKFWKGSYGFITVKGMNEDAFIHQKNIVMDGFRSLKEGDRVQFTMKKGLKGYEAYACQPLSGNS